MNPLGPPGLLEDLQVASRSHRRDPELALQRRNVDAAHRAQAVSDQLPPFLG
jgi:hypothetical protein